MMAAAIQVTEEEIRDAFPFIAQEATRYRDLPPGINLDDLESAGNAAMMEAAAGFDPSLNVPFRAFARTVIRRRMINTIRSARTYANHCVQLEPEINGVTVIRADPRAADPSDRMVSRDALAKLTQPPPVPGWPSPSAVASRADAIRAEMFAAIGEGDAAAIVRSVTDKAKAGDIKAARLFFDLIAPARAGQTIVQQQAIVIDRNDLD